MVKVNIISGFLGAGKTTLIKKLLTGSVAKEKIILLENEYGEVGVDGSFMKDSCIIVDELNSGCICCTLVGDFQKAVDDLIAKYHPDRLLIEPSGVGKLSEILAAVERAKERHSDLVVTGCATVVDAGKCRMYMKNFGEFFLDQIKTSATVIFSRTQLLSAERIEKSRALVEEQHPGVRIVTTPWDDLSADTLLEVIESGKPMEIHLDDDDDDDDEDEHEHHHHHEDGEECCCHHHHDDDHDDHDGHLHDGHEEEIEYDEHIWTSPVNAMALCRALCDTLCQADPDNADGYRARLEDYLGELQALDHTFRDIVDGAARRLVVFGDRFPLLYFCKEYDLDYRAAFHGCAGDTEPSLATLKYLIDLVNEQHIPVVYTIELSSRKVANAIAETTGAQVRTFHSCQTVSRGEFDGGATYISLMTANAAALKEGLA